MSAINADTAKRRWIAIWSVSHILYETDQGHHRTVCGILSKGEPIVCAKMEEVRRHCPKCVAKLRRDVE